MNNKTLISAVTIGLVLTAVWIWRNPVATRPPETSDSPEKAKPIEQLPLARLHAPPELIESAKNNPLDALKNASNLPLVQFLAAIQKLEETDSARAQQLLIERIRATVSEDDRSLLFSFPARFRQAGSHHSFALWALREKNLHLTGEELRLVTDLYMSEPPPFKQMLSEYFEVLATSDSQYQRILAASLLRHAGPARKKVARRIEKITGLSALDLLAVPEPGQEIIELVSETRQQE